MQSPSRVDVPADLRGDPPASRRDGRRAARRIPVPGGRLIAAAAAAAALGLIAPLVPILALPWGASIALVLLLATVDLLLRPRRGCVSAARVVRPLQHVGRRSSYSVRLRNETDGPLAVRLVEVLPSALEGEGIDERFVLAPSAEVERDVDFVGLERGTHALLPLGLRIAGPLGLLEFQERVPLEERVLVAPGRPAGESEWLLARSAALERLGEKQIRRRGSSYEFDSIRPYVTGDEIRRIDWKASARRQKPQVRLFRAERNAEIIVALDCGRLMGTVIEGVRKLDLAMTPVLDLAAVALRRKESVGFLAFDSRPRSFLPPRAGLAQLGAITAAMAGLPDGTEATSYLRAVRYLDSRHRKRSLIVVFTDFTDEVSAEEMIQSLASLTRRHVLIFVGVGDPHIDEIYRHSGGDLRSLFQKAVAGGLLQERRRSMRRIERLGIFTVDAEPKRLSGPLLRRFLEVRLRGVI